MKPKLFTISRKIIAGIIITIILGALGSGLWELAFSPLFKWITNSTVNFFSSISQSFENSIYIKVGDGNKDVLVHTYFSVMYGIIIFVPLFLLLSTYLRIKDFKKRLSTEETEPAPIDSRNILSSYKRIRILFWLQLPLNIIISAVILLSVLKSQYTHNKIIYIDQSMDIIAPYVSTNDLLKLKSEYRQINSKANFDKFNIKLRSIARQNNINLRTDY